MTAQPINSLQNLMLTRAVITMHSIHPFARNSLQLVQLL